MFSEYDQSYQSLDLYQLLELWYVHYIEAVEDGISIMISHFLNSICLFRRVILTMIDLMCSVHLHIVLHYILHNFNPVLFIQCYLFRYVHEFSPNRTGRLGTAEISECDLRNSVCTAHKLHPLAMPLSLCFSRPSLLHSSSAVVRRP